MNELQVYLIIACSIWVLLDGLHDRYLRAVESYKRREREERRQRLTQEINNAKGK